MGHLLIFDHTSNSGKYNLCYSTIVYLYIIFRGSPWDMFEIFTIVSESPVSPQRLHII